MRVPARRLGDQPPDIAMYTRSALYLVLRLRAFLFSLSRHSTPSKGPPHSLHSSFLSIPTQFSSEPRATSPSLSPPSPRLERYLTIWRNLKPTGAMMW